MPTRSPLKFKYQGSEFVFARNAVSEVQLLKYGYPPRHRPSRSASTTWSVRVNGTEVYRGREATARKNYERALKYVT